MKEGDLLRLTPKDDGTKASWTFPFDMGGALCPLLFTQLEHQELFKAPGFNRPEITHQI